MILIAILVILVRGIVFKLTGEFCDLSNFRGLIIPLKKIDKSKFYPLLKKITVRGIMLT